MLYKLICYFSYRTCIHPKIRIIFLTATCDTRLFWHWGSPHTDRSVRLQNILHNTCRLAGYINCHYLIVQIIQTIYSLNVKASHTRAFKFSCELIRDGSSSLCSLDIRDEESLSNSLTRKVFWQKHYARSNVAGQ